MNTSTENIVYTDFTEKKVFEQLTLACSTSHRHGSQEVSISECDVTWRTVKVDRYCLPATTTHAISHVTFPAFDFSIVSYMRLLFQLQGQYCFWLTTKQAIGALHLNSPPCDVTFGD